MNGGDLSARLVSRSFFLKFDQDATCKSPFHHRCRLIKDGGGGRGHRVIPFSFFSFSLFALENTLSMKPSNLSSLKFESRQLQ